MFLGGILGRPTPPHGGRAGSENDTLLPITMTCDRLKFWNGPAWRSKVIIRKPSAINRYLVGDTVAGGTLFVILAFLG